MKKFLVIIIGIVIGSAHSLNAQSPYEVLGDGILGSSISKVHNALNDKDLNVDIVHFGEYQDTALMLAIRTYCQTLLKKSNAQRPDISFSTLLASAIPAAVGGGLVYALTSNKAVTAFCAITLLPATSLINFFSQIRLAPAGRVVDLLLRSSHNLEARNKEGLTALDILKSYHEVATQLQDEQWFKFLRILSSNGTQQESSVMDDIMENLKKESGVE